MPTVFKEREKVQEKPVAAESSLEIGDAGTSVYEAPKGTTAVLTVFGVSIVVLWGFMYLIMLMRG